MTSLLQPIAVAMLDAFGPLERALREPDTFRLLLRNLGWEKTFEDAVLTEEPLASIATSASELLETGSEIVRTLESGVDEGQPLVFDLLDVLVGTRTLIEGLAELDTARLPDALSDPAFWAAVALDLPEYLLTRYLERHHAVFFAVLRGAGVIEVELVQPAADRVPYLRRTVTWEALTDLVADPAAHLQALYRWDDTRPFEHAKLLDAVARVGAACGLRVERLALREKLIDDLYGGTAPELPVHELALPVLKGVQAGGFAEHGVLAAPAPRRSGGAIDSLFFGNLTWGAASVSTELAPDWLLRIAGSADATGAVGLLLSPGSAAFVSEPVDQRYEIAVEGTPADPWRPFGGATGSRLELNGARLALAFEAAGEPELIVEAGTLPSADRGGLTLTIDPAESDAFLRALVTEPLLVDADLTLRWSSLVGLSIGGAGLAITLPIDKTIGPVTLESLTIGVGVEDGHVALAAVATCTGVLGPFALRIENIGLALDLIPGAANGLIGDLGVEARFEPPTAIGFSLDIADVVRGGGIIGHQPEIGRWWGGLAVDFLAVGLAAVVVIDTQLPGDPDGWSFFASISATFPSLPLGFGFFLSGVGGLVCLNRALDADALAAGLKDGAIDALLFPDDVLVDAPLIAASIDDWFPQAPGSSVFAVAAQIDWGTPKAIVRGQLGVAVALPELEIAILGSLSMVLPDEQTTEVELHLDSLGLIDPAERTVWITAALYDSSIVGAFQLYGGMATYASFGANPYFLLAVGGYHPAFDPPGHLPAAVTDLDRVGFQVELSEDIWFGVEGYVAVTSNTLQFGAEATLEASTTFLLTRYTATGSIGFDVLLTFSPFAFVFDAHATVEVTAGGRELFGAELHVHLDGPQPWVAHAWGTVDFFGLNVRFDVTFGGSQVPVAPPRTSVLDAVLAGLAAPESWQTIDPSAACVVFAAEPKSEDGSNEQGAAPLRVRPDAELEVRQHAAPLDRDLDVYGIYAIDGPAHLALREAGLEGIEAATWSTVDDWFAPAQFDVLSRSEKLAAASYEAMVAGARIAAGGVDTGSDSQSLTPDPEVRILDSEQTRAVKGVRFDSSLTRATAPYTFAAATTRNVGSSTFAIDEPRWTRIDPVSGVAIGQPGTYAAELSRLRTRRVSDPTARIAPTAAARIGR